MNVAVDQCGIEGEGLPVVRLLCWCICGRLGVEQHPMSGGVVKSIGMDDHMTARGIVRMVRMQQMQRGSYDRHDGIGHDFLG